MNRKTKRVSAKVKDGIPAYKRERWLAERTPLQAQVLNFVLDRAKASSKGCWEWQLALNGPNGYGQTHLRSMLGKRPHQLVAWALGWAVEGFYVCHHCDNKRCVRPDHLFVGTAHDNVRDCMEKGRFKPPPKTPWPEIMKERPHHWQKVSREQVREIKARLAAGESRKSVASAFGVTAKYIGPLARGERWAHL